MTGNGNHSTHTNGDDWEMVYEVYGIKMWLKQWDIDPQNHSAIPTITIACNNLSCKWSMKNDEKCFAYLCGYGSIPINTIFRGMNIHKSQLF